jgi:hypothetical protein
MLGKTTFIAGRKNSQGRPGKPSEVTPVRVEGQDLRDRGKIKGNHFAQPGYVHIHIMTRRCIESTAEPILITCFEIHKVGFNAITVGGNAIDKVCQ